MPACHSTEPGRPDCDATGDRTPAPARGFEERPVVRGKFIHAGGRKFHVQGVTYGTFRTREDGTDYPDPEVVARDFELMRAHHINSVRTYTVPPLWLLDLALQHGLRVMVGLPWEQHITFLDDDRRARAIELKLRENVRRCARHPAILCYAIGNEIPAPIARWHGQRELERFLARLYNAAKEEDPQGLVTYVNYPSTEYLRLPFVDFVCFNVYLESQQTLDAYLARLHHLAGDRPLVMAEIGLDSQRHTAAKQAETLGWQITTCMAAGCAGAFIFAWTDEWHRGGHDILDWDFGLTTRDRIPKPALTTVGTAFASLPFPTGRNWPPISVIVCTYNGARTLGHCLQQLSKLEYPHYEVIVVNDGSTDQSASIAARAPVQCRLITTPNMGLSSARNTGLKAATGEIVVYIDDDAHPDPHWLHYLAATFETTGFAAVGGPNIAPPGDGPIAECVLNAPGGPIHVMLSDREAEHIPGCNMAFRREILQSIGGFDPLFRVAGDDVDVCWRLQQQGWKLGFNPAAMVWHHRRNSIRAYWKQQQGYGKAEALLEKKWPAKYNAIGHVRWSGQLYGNGLARRLSSMGRIYHGAWGSAPFQSYHEPHPTLLSVLPTVPEWYLVLLGIAALASIGLLWTKLLWLLPLLAFGIGITVFQAALSAAQANYPSKPRRRSARLKRHAVTFCLHLTQPIARLYGRIRHGLTAWRLHAPRGSSFPSQRTVRVWSETWRSSDDQLRTVESNLRQGGAIVQHGGDYDRWDMEVRGDLTGSARTLMTVEEHGGGKLYFKFRIWPHYHTQGRTIIALITLLAAGAFLDDAPAAGRILAAIAAVLFFRALQAASYAISSLERAVRECEPNPPPGGDS